jgi:predicted signal transduction protein with EAL and GGDEF domain
MRREAGARRLLALKSLGVRIAIDGFGAGPWSLGFLRPIDALKDRSCVRRRHRDESRVRGDHAHLVALGEMLGIDTRAEGAEETATAERAGVANRLSALKP